MALTKEDIEQIELIKHLDSSDALARMRAIASSKATPATLIKVVQNENYPTGIRVLAIANRNSNNEVLESAFFNTKIKEIRLAAINHAKVTQKIIESAYGDSDTQIVLVAVLSKYSTYENLLKANVLNYISIQQITSSPKCSSKLIFNLIRLEKLSSLDALHILDDTKYCNLLFLAIYMDDKYGISDRVRKILLTKYNIVV